MASWRPVPLTIPLRSSPPLLALAEFSESAYAVHLTDLSHVWSESLSRADILSRASTENTTIDPSSDPSQLSLLLSKLSKSVTSPSPLASLTIKSPTPSQLQLQLQYVLPAPLPPLKWTFQLFKGSPLDFTNLFVLPLLARATTAQEEVDELVGTIKEKDAVIEKLVDQLEDSKVDVRVIVGRRKRALKPFDREAWEKEGSTGRKRIRDVVDGLGTTRKEDVETVGRETEDWLSTLEDSVRTRAPVALRAPVGEPKEAESETGSETEDEVDDFAVRKTPPRGQPSEIKPEMRETQLSPPLAPVRSPPPPRVPQPRRLGKIGGRKLQPQPTSPLPVPVEEEVKETEREKTPPPIQQSAPRKIGKIGKIGGRIPSPPTPGNKPESLSPPPPQEPTSPPARKIGKIGKISGRKATAAAESVPVPPPPRQPTPPPATAKSPTPEEDDEARADRKRRQLQEELEAKQRKGGAQKKRRKF